MMNMIQAILSVIFLSSFLGGCATSSPSNSGCMKTILVSNASKAPLRPVIKGDPRIVTISGFKGGCGGSSSDLPGGEEDIGITMTLRIPEAKQKNDRVRTVAFPVFVALLDKKDTILDRHDEMITVAISDHSLEHTHKIIYHPPEGIDVTSKNHRLLVGFNDLVVSPTHAFVPSPPKASQRTFQRTPQRVSQRTSRSCRVSTMKKKPVHKKKRKGKKKCKKKKNTARKKVRK